MKGGWGGRESQHKIKCSLSCGKWRVQADLIVFGVVGWVSELSWDDHLSNG